MYVGIGAERGKRVYEDEALNYALDRCGISLADSDAPEQQEFCVALVEWYFSGDWRKEDVV